MISFHASPMSAITPPEPRGLNTAVPFSFYFTHWLVFCLLCLCCTFVSSSDFRSSQHSQIQTPMCKSLWWHSPSSHRLPVAWTQGELLELLEEHNRQAHTDWLPSLWNSTQRWSEFVELKCQHQQVPFYGRLAVTGQQSERQQWVKGFLMNSTVSFS